MYFKTIKNIILLRVFLIFLLTKFKFIINFNLIVLSISIIILIIILLNFNKVDYYFLKQILLKNKKKFNFYQKNNYKTQFFFIMYKEKKITY